MDKIKNHNKISGSVKFLIIVLIIYSATALLNFSITEKAFLNFLQMFIKIVPILTIIFATMIRNQHIEQPINLLSG